MGIQRTVGLCNLPRALLFSGLQCSLKTRPLHIPHLAKRFGLVGFHRHLQTMHPRPATIAELCRTASSIFSMQDFKSLRWVGVHGNLAYSKEDEPSSERDHEDVDIVAVWDPETYRTWHSASVDRQTRLEEKLRQAWQREIYLLDITEGKLGDNTHTDAILCSRTVYGSAQDRLVVKLRMDARAIVDQERYIYSRVSQEIREVQALLAKTRVEDFKNSAKIRNGFETRVNSILKDLDFTDKDPLLKTAYRYTILEPASELRNELETYRAEPNSTSNPESSYWKAIWFALTNYDDHNNTLGNFEIWINQQIIPNLEDAIRSSEELQRRDATNSPT